MQLLYNLALGILHLGLWLAAGFHPKAQKWLRGRKHWRTHLIEAVGGGENWIWFHAASLGEFEQGRNLIEALKRDHPHYKILLTFFSPSGYEVRKHYALADHVAYLPVDHPGNARDFLQILKPVLAVFIKYELWLNYLSALRRSQTPVILISAAMTTKSRFFHSPFAPLYRQGFLSFSAIFTQDASTARLIEAFCNHPQVLRSADTRYDRVKANRETFLPVPGIEAFKRGRFCIVAGSTWPVDEKLLFDTWDSLAEEARDLTLILAPHEIQPQRIQRWISRYAELSLPYSRIEALEPQHRILWIDNIGMLSRLYHYAELAYVGGGFSGRLHNILEAATFGCPVSFGPRFHRFPEATALVAEGGGFPVESPEEMAAWIRAYRGDTQALRQQREKNRSFIDAQAGATKQILDWCLENGLIKGE